MIRQVNESELIDNKEQNDNFETLDEENWDEIDASFLQNCRGRLQKRCKVITS